MGRRPAAIPILPTPFVFGPNDGGFPNWLEAAFQAI
jgi:hypothetical protein